MKVWVKESGDFSIDKIKKYIRKGIEISNLNENTNISYDDIIIVSDKQKELPDRFQVASIFVFEEAIDKIMESVYEEVNYNFDYYYLKQKLDFAKKTHINTLITGSSYYVLDLIHEMSFS